MCRPQLMEHAYPSLLHEVLVSTNNHQRISLVTKTYSICKINVALCGMGGI